MVWIRNQLPHIAWAADAALRFWRAVADNELPQALPTTARALSAWDGRSAPDETLFKPFVADLREASPRDLAALARRLERELEATRVWPFSSKKRRKASRISALFIGSSTENWRPRIAGKGPHYIGPWARL